VRQSIRGYADGTVRRVIGGDLDGRAGTGAAATAAPATLAEQMAAVRDVIAASDDLRRVLTDPGVPAPARRGVLADLFGSRVDPAVSRLIEFVIDNDRAGDTADDISWLAARLEAAARGMEPFGEKILGHKAAEERLDGFATAILEAAPAQSDLNEIEDELFRFHRVVLGSAELHSALASRDLSADARRGVVTDLLESRAKPATAALAAYATTIGRPRDYEDLLEHLVARVAAESNRRLAEVRSAVELDDRQRQDLAGALSRAVGHDVEVRVTVDPSVVAGFVATIGDTVVDGSARHQLELLKERLVMPEARITTGQTTTEERQ
jgi:F-type H+-transporting ATPase subunit delta